ncbi:MAG: SurA N-terminal domain-containing protein [Nitrospiria bacterium]
MLKFIRRGAIENPWFFRIVMLGIAVVFGVSMGWWGFGQREDNTIAEIGQSKITLVEYQRAYQAASKFYREIFQEEYDDEALRERVIDELIERKLWLQLAQNMGLDISDASLRESITAMPGFQKDGHFNPELYRRVLAFERYTPQSFERKQREALMVEKAKILVKEGIALSPAEIAEATESDPANPDPERAVEDILYQKRERGLRAYTLSLKEKAEINIKKELL